MTDVLLLMLPIFTMIAIRGVLRALLMRRSLQTLRDWIERAHPHSRAKGDDRELG